MSTVRLHVVASIALAWMMGCGPSSEHPAPAGDGEGDVEEARQAAETASRIVTTCVPFSTRACKRYYTTADGHLHCPPSIEVCREDGKGFGDCGEIPPTMP